MDWSKSRLKIVLNIVYETRRTRKPRDKIMRVLRRIDLFIFLLYKLYMELIFFVLFKYVVLNCSH